MMSTHASAASEEGGRDGAEKRGAIGLARENHNLRTSLGHRIVRVRVRHLDLVDAQEPRQSREIYRAIGRPLPARYGGQR